MTLFGISSSTARRAITLRSLNSTGLARERRVEVRAVRLHVMLGLGEHHAVDEDSRHLDVAGVQRALRSNALHLRNDDAARIAGGDCEREILERQRLALGGDVAVGIRSRAADERNVDRECLEEQHVLAVDLEHPDDVLLRSLVHPAAAVARVDVGA
jgi:hypothetical protein